MLPTNGNQPQENAQEFTQNQICSVEASQHITQYLKFTLSGQLLTEEQKQKVEEIFHMPTLSVIQYKQIEEIIARQGQLMATYATEATGTTIFSNVPTAPYGLNRAPLFDNHAQFLQSGSQEPETSGWHSQEHVSKPLQHTELMPSNPEQTHMQLLLQQCNYYCNVQETRSKPEDFFSSTAHFEVDHRSTDVDSLAQKEDVNTHAYYSFFPPSTPNRMNPHRIFDENHIRTPTSALKRTRI